MRKSLSVFRTLKKGCSHRRRSRVGIGVLLGHTVMLAREPNPAQATARPTWHRPRFCDEAVAADLAGMAA